MNKISPTEVTSTDFLQPVTSLDYLYLIVSQSFFVKSDTKLGVSLLQVSLCDAVTSYFSRLHHTYIATSETAMVQTFNKYHTKHQNVKTHFIVLMRLKLEFARHGEGGGVGVEKTLLIRSLTLIFEALSEQLKS
jgi:hypothetical protein